MPKKQEFDLNGCHTIKVSLAGFWFAGWLFTLGLLKLMFWYGVLAIVIWPYYLGSYVAGAALETIN